MCNKNSVEVGVASAMSVSHIMEIIIRVDIKKDKVIIYRET